MVDIGVGNLAPYGRVGINNLKKLHQHYGEETPTNNLVLYKELWLEKGLEKLCVAFEGTFKKFGL